MKFLFKLVLALLLLAAALAGVLRLRYGGGSTGFPDRTTAPLLPEAALEVVATLPTPPGNIAVSKAGRVFLSLHPEARPAPNKIVEIVNGQARPFPSAALQPKFVNVLGIRLDSQDRLWTLDNGGHGVKPARLMAFDIATGKTAEEFEFPREIAGLGSHLNDLQVSADGRTIYIADASFFGKHPAIVVYDVQQHSARRLLENTVGVTPENYIPVVQGRTMLAFGLVAIRPGVDSIALSRDGQWLYFAPVTSQHLYRISTANLQDRQLSAEKLATRVEAWAEKSMSDGLSSDNAGNIYLTDPEHSALLRLSPEKKLDTLLKTERLRWPDGLSFGADGWLYVTCSSLQFVIGLPPASVAEHAPYQVYRFKPGGSAAAGQ